MQDSDSWILYVKAGDILRYISSRMLGTFNQYLPMILSNNYWHQSKPTSLHDIGMGVVP